MINNNYGLTVGELLDFIEKNNISRDAVVLTQRVEDKYFDGCDISGCTGQLPDGSYGILPPGSKAQGWPVETFPDLDVPGYSTHYFQAHCCINRDDKNLYIENHY